MSQPEIIAERYEVLEEIGQGGMGKVYRGKDTATGQLVAIKALKPEVVESDPSMVERFDREGEALRRLNHPNMVRVLANIEEGGNYYLVMDYVAGGTLNDLMLGKEPMRISQVLNIALDLADALTRAHRLRILHRDIKPANVLIAEDGTPRLTDFGVARMEDRSRVTEAGMIIGTYNYLSPEALQGEEPDERSDIWAFGVLLFEMLTGKRPFERAQVGAILGAILSDPPPDITALRPDAPPALADLVNRMLEKKPDQRISSARQVGVALEDIIRSLDGQEVPIDSALKQQVQEHTRFEATPTDAQPVPVPPPSAAARAVEAGVGYTILQDATGQEYVVMKRRTVRRRDVFAGAVAAVLLLGGLVLIALLLSGQFEGEAGEDAIPTTFTLPTTVAGGGDTGDRGDGVPAAPPDTEPPTADRDPLAMPPVPAAEEGNLLVLVAQPEPVAGDDPLMTPGDVARIITGDLRERLENVPFSDLEVRMLPVILRDAQQAVAVAEHNMATVIVWGSYDAEALNINVHLGGLAAFNYITFERDMIENMINVRVRLEDPRTQTLAPQVLGVIATAYAADGDGYNYLKTLALYDTVGRDVLIGDMESSSISPYSHEAFRLYMIDETAAVEAIEQALARDAGNPMLYSSLALINVRIGDDEAAANDAETSLNLTAEEWASPWLVQAAIALAGAAPPAEGIAALTRILELRPDDWWALSLRAALYYAVGRYDNAAADATAAIELGPDVSLPYVYLSMIAVREGRLDDARDIQLDVLRLYPDPTLLGRVLTITFADRLDLYGTLVATYGYLLIGQPERAINKLASAGEAVAESADLSFFGGVAACEQGDYETASGAFLQAARLDPSFIAAHLLYASAMTADGHRVLAGRYLANVATEVETEAAGIIRDFRALLLERSDEEPVCAVLF